MHKGYKHITMVGPPFTHQVTPRVERAQEFIKKKYRKKITIC